MKILLIEDSPEDAALLQRALMRIPFTGELKMVMSAEGAVAYLKTEMTAKDGKLPDLIILDLKLPQMSGMEFLGWVRAQPGLAGLPVIVLTSSPYAKDVSSAYELGAKTFFAKPFAPGELEKLAANIVTYWEASTRGNVPGNPPV